MGRTVSLVALLFAMVAAALCGMQSAGATTNASPNALAASATVNGRDASKASTGDPIQLSPDQTVDVAVEMTNNGTAPVIVSQVEFTGRVLRLNFFSYSTPVEATVLPESTQTLRYRLDLTGLRGQATGLIGAEFTIKDGTGKAILTIPTVTDVRGSLMSVYGFFGVALIVLTALALVDVAIALARHSLSTNRWQRGMRLLAPGIGIGLVVAFSASVLRLWVPATGLWIVTAGLTAVVFFALGYFSPTPDGEDDEFDEFDDFAVSDLDLEDIAADEFHR